MLNLDLLFENVPESKVGVTISSKEIKISILNNKGDKVLNSEYLNILVGKIKTLFKYKPSFRVVHILLDIRMFGDDAVVICFELILKAIFDYGYKEILLELPNLSKSSHTHQLYLDSFFGTIKYVKHRMLREDYLDRFNSVIVDKTTDFYNKKNIFGDNYYRIIVRNEGFNKITSRIGGEVLDFLKKRNLFDDEYISSVVNVIMETMDNVLSHTESDCILSIKNCDLYGTIDNLEKIMLSIVILDISNHLLFTQIKDKIQNDDLAYSNEVISEAYLNHKKEFADFYDLDFFSMISTFQKGITTRNNAKYNSGRGLTKFLRAIKEKTNKDDCYVYSGNKLIYFKDEYLNVNDKGFIGFNEENDYVEHIPNKANLSNLDYYLPGTLYNLMLFYNRRDLNE